MSRVTIWTAPVIKCCLPVRHRTILPADLTLPESGAMPEGFCTFSIADPIIIQFDLPAGCRKHFGLRWQRHWCRSSAVNGAFEPKWCRSQAVTLDFCDQLVKFLVNKCLPEMMDGQYQSNSHQINCQTQHDAITASLPRFISAVPCSHRVYRPRRLVGNGLSQPAGFRPAAYVVAMDEWQHHPGRYHRRP